MRAFLKGFTAIMDPEFIGLVAGGAVIVLLPVALTAALLAYLP